MCSNADDKLLEAEVQYELGLALSASGDVTGARDTWSQSLQGFQRIGALTQAQWVRDAIAGLEPAKQA